MADGSVGNLASAIRDESAALLEVLKKKRSALRVLGVAYAGQSDNVALKFGRLYTGTGEPNRTGPKCAYGDMYNVILGTGPTTKTLTMMELATKNDVDRLDQLHSEISAGQPPPVTASSMDMDFYGRYHHMFNQGEFTEVACVKCPGTQGYVEQIHQKCLSDRSEYRLTLSHGAMPMCIVSLVVTVRQAVCMVMGFICLEVARGVYSSPSSKSSSSNLVNVCSRMTSMSPGVKFWHGKGSESTKAMEASCGSTLKLSAPVFARSSGGTQNLDKLEWLDKSDGRLPGYLRGSLEMIGDTKAQVIEIMQNSNVSYNRFQFWTGPSLMAGLSLMKFATMYENEDTMIHAPLIMPIYLRLFANTQNSYGSAKPVKSKSGKYNVHLMSNEYVDRAIYKHDREEHFEELSVRNGSLDILAEAISREVSRLVPRIDVCRVRVLAPDLESRELLELVAKVKAKGIEVTGDLTASEPHKRSEEATPSTIAPMSSSAATKRPHQPGTSSKPCKTPRTEEGGLLFYDSDSYETD